MPAHVELSNGCFHQHKSLLFSFIKKKTLINAIEMAIFTFGAVAYQNECGITASGFLDVLKLYFASTFEEWNDEVFLQKNRCAFAHALL